MERSPQPTAAPQPGTHPWLAFLDLIPAAWLLALAAAYFTLAVTPVSPSTAAVPGIAEAERAALPLLAAAVVAGIIRWYVGLRSPGPQGAVPDTTRPAGGGEDRP